MGRTMKKSQRTPISWANSVPALDAPLGFAPSAPFMQRLAERFPTVSLRWDKRPNRRCFVLWEKTRSGRMAVIQDLPKGVIPDQRVIDHLTLCELATKPGYQSIINAVDQQSAKMTEERKRKAQKKECDWDRVLWAARKEARDKLSVPMGVFSQVPG